VTSHDLLRPLELDHAEREIEPVALDPCLVVRSDVRLVLIHAQMVHRGGPPLQRRWNQAVRVNEMSIQGCQSVPSSERSHMALID
jgi:hypothetical protein